MKNNVTLLFFIMVLLSSCSKESNKKDTQPYQSETPEFFDIILESGLNDYVISRNDRTWKDLDVFYQNSILKYKERKEIDNLKCATILCMVNFYKILDDKDTDATNRIGFYAQEMAGLKNCNPEVLYPMLIRLQGHWKTEKIKQIAKLGYENSKSLFEAMGKGTPTPEYEVRKEGMNKLLSLFEHQ